MDIIKKLQEDSDLAEILSDICDVNILPEFISPQDEDKHLTYNINGKTFAKEGSGSEYILLEDGSVGFWGSEGEGGRIADTLYDFFILMVNCPFWREYVCSEPYQDMLNLREFAKELYEEHIEMAQEDIEIDLCEEQQKLADGLGITLDEDVSNILMKFYHCANRQPRLIATFTEADGSKHSNSGSLFEA
ncbi:hypothetical protein [Anaerocolumna sp.]|uniref:hypothetical protein n=1 Tax=Anaerocolumna sp. TaxID=2041569 RepID=UPI0028AE4FD2|nr:hypothetical protein [Anaerocolumna sp.]